MIMAKTSLIAIIIIGALTITWLTIISMDNNTVNAIAQQQLHNESLKVAAGGGNGTGPLTTFYPKNIEIKSGQSVTWSNPTAVAEPHTVTFVMDNATVANVVSPLAVSNMTKFMSLPPGSNNAPILLQGKNGTNTIIAINARTFNPVVIDSSDNVKFMNPNAIYSMNGTEKYVNSGWFLPQGQEKAYPGSGNTFTVTFEKPGTYNYICILHPWMTGSIIVK
jgi:plastocyanin